jgi:hypothetical protein
MADCFFHTGRPAVTRCKQCGKPLCGDCRQVKDDGVFCGDKCADTFKVFAKRAGEIEGMKGGNGAAMKIVRVIIVLVVLFILYKVGASLLKR